MLILLANVIGLVGYVLHADGAAADVPGGRVRGHARRVLDRQPRQRPSSQLASNPYAAMPSLHAADALIVGVVMALVVPPPVGEGALGRLARRGSGSR